MISAENMREREGEKVRIFTRKSKEGEWEKLITKIKKGRKYNEVWRVVLLFCFLASGDHNGSKVFKIDHIIWNLFDFIIELKIIYNYLKKI